MKRYLFAFFCTLLFVGNIYAHPTSGICGDNLQWSYDEQTKTLSITGSGAMDNYMYNYGPWYVYKEKMTSIQLSDGITTIGNYAFHGCSSLASVTIPNGVKYIGYDAFHGCTSLISVNIPNSVTEIRDGAFEGCVSLNSVTIPNSTYIWSYAFKDVPNIIYYGSQKYDSGDLWWGAKSMNGYVDGLFVYRDETKKDLLACSAQASGEIIIPNTVTYIGQYAFYGCHLLTSVTIPNSVTYIDRYAFRGCTSLTSVNIPNGITSISWETFANCWSLRSITIPNSVKYIGYRAFSGCDSLTSVNIPNSVTEIEEQAFQSCVSLSSLNIPNSVTKIGWHACSSVPNIVYSGSATWGKNDKWWGARSLNGYVDGSFVYSDETKTKLLACLDQTSSEIIIPNTVTEIGEYAFRLCTSLTSVNIPNSVKIIGKRAFPFSLTSITIPNSVTEIGELAFNECRFLTSMTIPNSVKTIGVQAFHNCNSLMMTIPDNITEIGNNAFEGVPNIVYSGSATWHKYNKWWGAKSMNGYVDGFFVYSDETKTKLLACLGQASGEIIIPNTVTEIGEHAFDNCNLVTSVHIPNTVTEIGEYAFKVCTSLTSVNIPNSVKTIGQMAFAYCDSLSSISIGNSVKTIGYDAFGWCNSLNSIICYAKIPPIVSGSEMIDIPQASSILYVPKNSIEDYKNAEWKKFKYIRPIESTTDIENVSRDSPDAVRKIYHNGNIYILTPDGKKYTPTGMKL